MRADRALKEGHGEAVGVVIEGPVSYLSEGRVTCLAL